MAGKDFSNFKDLLGRFGGDDEEDETSSVVEGKAELAPAEDDEEEVDPGHYRGGARAIIDARPDGFGPMDHGPRAYRDVESEEMELLASFRIRTIFPADVEAEAEALPADPPPADYEGVAHRMDLRTARIFTIDGDDAKDYDDAIAIRAVDEGFEVSVHIADVSHYVRPGTALNAEALARATSVYVADQVVPMLPEKLSNGLCSLVPGRERLAFSVFMTFDREGRRKNYYLTKSVIRSFRRCTYRAVQKLLDGVDDDESRALADLRPDLEMFRAWTVQQQKIRDRKGSLRIQSQERKFRFDEDGNVVDIYMAPNYFSQTLIEETALAANQAVGDFFRANGLPTIYRIHPEKDEDEVKQITEMLEEYGVRVPKKDRLTGRDIGAMIRYARRLANAESMIPRIMSLLERASYEVQDHEDQAEHFGLAREHYLHFTSPIRRYPDLVVHRMLFDVLQRGVAAQKDLKDPERIHDLCDVASHASQQAEVAAMVEIAVADLKVCQFMDPRIGEVFEAKVGRVSPYGFDLDLVGLCVTGYLPAKAIGRVLRTEGPSITIRARSGTKVFKEGDTVEVTVKDVDFRRLKILFELHEKKRG
ncbi:MAG: VacB/RNase II family 3'-5' exoribonuclease [Planctomycetes bacterium]|nr:VacB/RNase II family 3'-5' exoribonuclease [Planctomycetota bacterium]